MSVDWLSFGLGVLCGLPVGIVALIVGLAVLGRAGKLDNFQRRIVDRVEAERRVKRRRGLGT